MFEVNNRLDLNIQLKKNRTVLALFYASWCPYCQTFLGVFDRAITKCGFDSIIRVNVDDYNNPLWEDYSIEAVPTVILFDGGKVCRRLDGELGVGLSAKQLDEWLKTT
jgi:thioredoxin 1